jgi:hypothetical protein
MTLNTSSFALNDENRMRIFQNKILMKVFGAKTEEVTGK